MAGTVWQRCTTCRRKVNGRQARQRHVASACSGSDATWAFRLSLGFDSDGVRRQQVRGGFATEADADRAVRELLYKVDQGSYVQPSQRTLGSFLVDEWLPAILPHLAGGTYRKRHRHVHGYITPRLGTMGLQDVTAAALERLYGQLASAGAGHGPLAPATIVDTHRTLHKAYEDAMRWGYVSRNPVAAARPPSMAKVKADARATLRVWTPEQLRRFLDDTVDHPYGLVFRLAAMTGARRSELLAVRWADVDLGAARMSFGRAAVLDADGKLTLRDSTKTSSMPISVLLVLVFINCISTVKRSHAVSSILTGQ